MTLLLFGLTIAIALGLAATPLFAGADAPPDHAPRRVSTIDGLRGFLALAVVVHHNTMYAQATRLDVWGLFEGQSTMLGQGGVAVFFMVTGYLFWRRLVLARGRIDWTRLYVGRVFRIGPLYVVAALAALLVSTPWTGGLKESVPALMLSVLRWLALGIFPQTEINGERTWFALVGVTWSLAWEWQFYALLPILSVFTRWGRLHVFAAAAAVIVAATGPVAFGFDVEGSAFCLFFSLGMLTASLQGEGVVPARSDGSTSVLLAGLLIYAVTGFDRGFAVGPAMVLGAAFCLVATGTSLFGLLRTRVAHRLGHVSYGIYLLQGLVITPVFRLAAPLVNNSRAAEIAANAVVAVVLVPAALLAHRWVEAPGIRLGDRVVRALRRPAEAGSVSMPDRTR